VRPPVKEYSAFHGQPPHPEGGRRHHDLTFLSRKGRHITRHTYRRGDVLQYRGLRDPRLAQ
ncbi:hypothetical protein SK128_005881, partial [Halocaridina rubra]